MVSVVVAEVLEAVVPQEGGKMQSLAEQFLTKEEQDRVTSAVQLAEKQTSGEIVPMIASKSHTYPSAILIGAVILSIPTAILFTSPLATLINLPPTNMWLFLCLNLLLFPIFISSIKKSVVLQSLFVSKSQIEEEVEKAAINAFYTEQLYKTRDENGILLYISVFEKKVWILGDAGINSKIEQSEWDNIISDLTRGIKDGNQCDAICAAVEKVGNTLKEHFPIQEDDINELHNIIIRA